MTLFLLILLNIFIWMGGSQNLLCLKMSLVYLNLCFCLFCKISEMSKNLTGEEITKAKFIWVN